MLAAFTVIAIVFKNLESEEISGLAGLSQRSPFLAASMTFAMVSLAGIPPLAGFFGKFLLLKAVIAQGAATHDHGYYWLAAITLVGVVISMYYYFGVVRAIYWSRETADLTPIELDGPAKVSLALCVAGIFWLGLFPNTILDLANEAAKSLGV